MRQILISIPWDGIPLGGVRVPIFGFGLLLGAWCLVGVWSLFQLRRSVGRWTWPPVDAVVMWLVIAAIVVKLPDFARPAFPDGLPIFGYGAMILVGLVSGVKLAERRAQRAGIAPETIWDLAMWLFVPGIIGARVLFLIKSGHVVYADARTWGDMALATVALWKGGLVLQGGLIVGGVAYFVFCRRYHIPPLTLADICAPSVFLGIGFGRIGCLLYGCCFGDVCTLPWAITFPPESVVFKILVERGFLAPDAPHTPPLHPTQIYSSLDGFLICVLSLWYARYRRGPGDVLAFTLIVSSITRFFLEMLRGDELGVGGTDLTSAQWISLALLVVGFGLQAYVGRRARREMSANLSAGGPSAASGGAIRRV